METVPETKLTERILDFSARRAIVGVPGFGINPAAPESTRAIGGMCAKEFSIMAELNESVVAGLAGYYEFVAVQLHKWVDPLSNEQFWRKPFPYGNSVGHLVLHMTGNLNYYIGTRVAETGYVRDRDREFTDKQPPPKEEALRAFDRTIGVVVATIRKQSAENWGKAYTAEREPEAADRFQIFVRCAGHAYHHVGQIVYLSRELART
jgi:uncharacterized damage-inducible protein DinB